MSRYDREPDERGTRRTNRKREPDELDIKPLVRLDFILAGVLVLVAILVFAAAAAAATPAAAAGVGFLAAIVFGLAILLAMSGALLFFRQRWAFIVALVVHVLLLGNQVWGVVLLAIHASHGAPMNMTAVWVSIALGAAYFRGIVYAWKLIQATSAQRQQERHVLRQNDTDLPETDTQRSWDDAPDTGKKW